jgi:hypothetical protein
VLSADGDSGMGQQLLPAGCRAAFHPSLLSRSPFSGRDWSTGRIGPTPNA